MIGNQENQENGVDYSTLKPISFSELRDMKISCGDLYWKKANGKFVKVHNCGDHTSSKLDRYKKVTAHLFIDLICNEEFINKGSSIISKILISLDEAERLRLRDEFLALVQPVFWEGRESGSILDLIMIFKRTLYGIDHSFEEVMEANAFTYHRRSVLSATLITIFAICSGYTHGDFLKDLFNICHFFDYSLSEKESSVEDISHIKQSRKLLIESNFYSPKNMNLSRLIEFHHELLNEQGPVLGLNSEEIGDLERIIIWIENTLPFSIEEFSKNDGNSFLKKIVNGAENQEAFIDLAFKEKLLALFCIEEVELEQVA
jgi:hypothetical protein